MIVLPLLAAFLLPLVERVSVSLSRGLGPLVLLAVTLLTHLDDEAMAELDLTGDSRGRALSWAALAQPTVLSGWRNGEKACRRWPRIRSSLS